MSNIRRNILLINKFKSFFLTYDYTHLIIWADDLLADASHILRLVGDVLEKDYPVIGGICQIDNDWYADNMIISLKPLYPKRGSDRWRYFEKFANYYNYQGKLLSKYQKKPIIRTLWQGFPMICIRRDVFDYVSFRNDAEFNDLPISEGCCIDDTFCYDCIQNEIPMFTDLRVRMNHLKFNDNNTRTLIVKNKQAHTKFVKATKQLHPDLLPYELQFLK